MCLDKTTIIAHTKSNHIRMFPKSPILIKHMHSKQLQFQSRSSIHPVNGTLGIAQKSSESLVFRCVPLSICVHAECRLSALRRRRRCFVSQFKSTLVSISRCRCLASSSSTLSSSVDGVVAEVVFRQPKCVCVCIRAHVRVA